LTRPFTKPLARAAAALGFLAALSGCGPDYSPNTYSSNAVQQAEKVDKGVIVGVRPVDVTSSGVIGAATGAAAGGALGAQSPGGGVTSTLGAIGGGLVGGLIGTATEHTVTDTTAYEYIVQKPTKELESVTQKDAKPLTIGTHVLVIAGPQARIVPDYTVEPDPTADLVPPPSPKPAGIAPAETPPAAAGTAEPTPPTATGVTAIAPPPPAVTETPLSLLPALPAGATPSPAAAGAAAATAVITPSATPPTTTPAAAGAAVGATVGNPMGAAFPLP